MEHSIEVLTAKLQETALSNSEHYRELLKHQISNQWHLVDLIERQKDPIKTITCPLCDYQDSVDKFKTYESNCIFGGGKLLRHQCANCDVIFGPQKMLDLSTSELSKDYIWHYKVFSEGDSTEAEVRAFLAMNPTKEGTYLNWGAGRWSNTINLLRSEGWNVYGYEPHSSAADQGEYVISNEEDLEKMRFEGIFSNNLLEHLQYPVDELTKMSHYLREDGTMSHATPCFEYLYEYTRFHLFFFLGRSWKTLARRAGLHVKKFYKDGEFMNILLCKQ